MLEKNINRLVLAADDPKKTIEETCRGSGKRAVGWVAPYAPQELIEAAGCIPVGLWGGQAELKRARTYLPPFACSIMQSIMEYETDGTYDILSAVLIPAVCDTLKCFGQKWKGTCPAIPFVHPQNRRDDHSVAFLTSEYQMIRKKLEEILQVEITDQKISESIILYNEYRSVMREFTGLAADYPLTITPTVRHKIIKAGYFMEKAEYIAIMKQINSGLRLRKPESSEDRKVVVTGLTLEPDGLLEIFEQFHLQICADDLAQESRQFRTDVPWFGTPVESLAKQWQNHSGCSLAFDPYKSRIQMLVDMVRAKKADGLILALMKFCDPEEYDVPIIMETCKEAGIPFLTIEIDQQSTSYEQIRTRIQSFTEQLNHS